MMVWGVFSQINMRMRDSMYEPYPVSNVLTIVEVGDEDLAHYGRWDGWPRSLHAALIDHLSQAGARAILIDFVFAAEMVDDPVLAEAMRRAGVVVQPVLGLESANLDRSGKPRYPDIVEPNPGLLNESAMVGHTNIIHDQDGYVRKAPTMIQVKEQQFMSLAMAAIQVFVGAEATLPAQAEGGILEFAGRHIPVDENGAMFIHYAGPPAVRDARTYQMVSYRSVIEDTVPEELIKDKIILVGITATGGKDFFLTPVSNGRPMAGIEILANTIETIWSSRFISQPAEGVRIFVLLLLGALVGLVSRHLWSGLAFTVIIALMYFLLASWLFDSMGVLLDLFYPFLVMLLSFMLAVIYRQTIRQA
jgi:CHASE2 domain-containing sensor protein